MIKKPFKVLTKSNVKLVLWENEKKDGSKFLTFQLNHIYKDLEGKWNTSNNFNFYHIDSLIDLLSNYKRSQSFIKTSNPSNKETEK